uniref:Uncharacterized protein n=1 Tax=Arundo donax TaxID=35708 RepID=A0A0A8YFN8_ARUDO
MRDLSNIEQTNVCGHACTDMNSILSRMRF